MPEGIEMRHTSVNTFKKVRANNKIKFQDYVLLKCLYNRGLFSDLNLFGDETLMLCNSHV